MDGAGISTLCLKGMRITMFQLSGFYYTVLALSSPSSCKVVAPMRPFKATAFKSIQGLRPRAIMAITRACSGSECAPVVSFAGAPQFPINAVVDDRHGTDRDPPVCQTIVS